MQYLITKSTDGKYANSNGDKIVITETNAGIQYSSLEEFLSKFNIMLFDKWAAIDLCKRRRAARYDREASIFDLADAETKMASPDATIKAEGEAQKATVLAKRLAIKSSIPKP